MFFLFNPTQISLSATFIIGTVTAALFGFYVISTFQNWAIHFSGSRVYRSDAKSPSNKQAPKVRSLSKTKEKMLTKSVLHKAFESCELIDAVKKMKERPLKRSARLRSLSKRKSFNGQKCDEEDYADELHMDHIYIGFLDYLWGSIFIGPMAYALWKKGTAWLYIRQKLVKWGILKVPEFDMERVIATLCLEQSQVIHYVTTTEKGSKLGSIAVFFFSACGYLDKDCNFKVADLFVVNICLDTKKFVNAKLDKMDLTPSQTLILLWFNTISAQHVKLHAMANWGLNNSAIVKEKNPFLYHNSVVSIIYNYYGYSTFGGFLKTWEKQGLLQPGWSDKGAFVKAVTHGIKEGIVPHSQVIELMNHSRFVKFAVKVRAIFIIEFGKYKHLFPGVDGEVRAYCLSTVPFE